MSSRTTDGNMRHRILMFSLSRELIDRQSPSREARDRQVAYAEHCDHVDIIVKAPKGDRFASEQLAANLRAVPTGTRGWLATAWRMYRMGLAFGRSRRPSLIVSQDPFVTGLAGLLVAWHLGVPLCVHYVCDLIDNEHWLRESVTHGPANRIGKFVLRRASAVRVDSPDQIMILRHLGVEAGRLHYVPFLQAGLEEFCTAPTDPALRRKLLGGGTSLVLFAGRLELQKDLETFVEVVENVTRVRADVRFVVAGDGSRRHWFEEELARRQLSAHCTRVGWVEFSDLARYFAAADVFLLTSRYETAARVLVLARARGLPIVSTDVSGAASIVEGGGEVVPVGRADQLADALVRILGDPEEAKARAAATAADVRAQFAPESVIAKLFDVYAKAVTVHRAHVTASNDRLCYVLPEYVENTEQHFFHTYQLLRVLAALVPTTVIVERGSGEPRLRPARAVPQRFRFPPLRMLEMLVVIARERFRGCRCFYVHYSYYGATAAWLVTRLCGGRVYYWHCVSVLFRKRGWSRQALSHRIRAELPLEWTMRIVDYIVTGTPSIARFYSESFGIARERILIVPNEIDPARFSMSATAGESVRHELDLSLGDQVVLFVHRVVARKGSEYLPDLLDRLSSANPRIRLVVVGDGPGLPRLKGEIVGTRHASNARLVGWVPNAEVPRYYAAADVFIMPSDEEGFPRVLLEAMAAGVPFVASDVGGVRDICTRKQQEFLVAPGDVATFATKVTDLLEHVGQRNDLRSEGLRRVRDFTVANVAAATLSQLRLAPAPQQVASPPAAVNANEFGRSN